MQIERMQLRSLVPAEYNPRRRLRPGDKEYEKLRQSVVEFGYVDPIIWNRRTGCVVGGHQRLQVLLDMGITEAEVSVVDLPDEKEKALNLALNRISGEWDQAALTALLEELSTADIDIGLTGFDLAEIDALRAESRGQTKVTEDNFDAEAAAAKIKEPVTQLGDLWLLGGHRLLCADATQPASYSKLMDGRLADMVFTDPPYNVNYEGSTGDRLKIQNDNLPAPAFHRFLLDAFSSCISVTAPGGAVYVFHADSEGVNFRTALLGSGWLIKQCLVWVKSQLVIGRQDYQWKHEPVLYGWKPGAGHRWYGGRKQTTVIDDAARVTISPGDGYVLISFSTGAQSVVLKVPSYEVIYQGDDAGTSVWYADKPSRNGEHPTMKPVALPGKALLNSSKRGDIVLDPFGGSGTTLIAAEQLGRACYMMELDPVYCDVIVTRWEQLTGRRATKV